MGRQTTASVARLRCYAALGWIWLAWSAAAQGLPTAAPADVGLSQEGLDRITAAIDEHVKERKVSGAVALLARRGKVAYVHGGGMADAEAGKPMAADTIFRIASMSKPITSVAAMVLYDEGRLKLDDPLWKYVPEFKDMQVLGEAEGATVPAKSQITLKHLLTHTAGFTYQWNLRLGKRYNDAGITHGLLQDSSTLAEKMKALAKQPLLFHPGEKYEYGLSTDVLGRVVEVASGQSQRDFLRTRLFEPLRMNDTHFFLPKEKVSRLAAVYGPDGAGGIKRLGEEPLTAGLLKYCVSYPYNGPRSYFSGGGGLCSTAPDYARFAQMLLNEGELDGARILRPETVKLMTTDHTGALTKGFGFGLGFAVPKGAREAGANAATGPYGWSGFWYTTFAVDPANEMVVVFMAQLYPSGGVKLQDTVKELARAAVVK